MEKYFFIALSLTKLVSISSLHQKEEDGDGDDIPGLEKENGPESSMKQMDKKIPMQQMYSTCIVSPSGLFIPDAIEDTVKNDTKADEASITFVREITKEEYQTNTMYATTKHLPPPVPQDIMAEIDDIVSRAESGELRPIVPLQSEIPKNKDQADLKKLGLDMGLFDDTGLWD